MKPNLANMDHPHPGELCRIYEACCAICNHSESARVGHIIEGRYRIYRGTAECSLRLNGWRIRQGLWVCYRCRIDLMGLHGEWEQKVARTALRRAKSDLEAYRASLATEAQETVKGE